MSFTNSQISDLKNTITVEGKASVEALCDVAIIIIRFKTKGLTTSAVAETTLRQSEEFLCSMQQVGVDLGKLKIRSEDYGEPKYYQEDDKMIGERSFELRTSFDVRFVNYIIQLVIDKHWDAHISVEYDVSDEAELREQLIQKAIKDSHNRARLIALAAGTSIANLCAVKPRNEERRFYCPSDDVYFAEDFSSYGNEKLSEQAGPPTKEIEEQFEVVWTVG